MSNSPELPFPPCSGQQETEFPPGDREPSHLDDAFQYSGIGMALVSLEGKWLRVNPAICRFLGFSENELLTTDFQSLTHPDDLRGDLELVCQLLNGEIETFTLEKRYRHKDGRFLWGLLTVSLVRDAVQAPAFFISQVQDINARKQVEDELRVEKERLALAAEAGRVGIWDFDVLAHTITWNDVMFDIHGVEEATYRPEPEKNALFLHPEDREVVRSKFAASLASDNRHYEIDVRIIRPDGSLRTTRCSAVILRDAEGRPLRVTGIEVDVTEERQLADTLARARDAAEAAARAKTDFLARMSHEIRTPMNAILGPAELLAESGVSPSQRELVNMITMAGEHLLEIINHVLDFSKMEAGGFSLVEEPFRLGEMVEETLAPFVVLAAARSTRLVSEIAPDAAGWLLGDRARLRQVVLNLVSNAVKFTRHGQIQVRVFRMDAANLRLEVEDTGEGLGEEDQVRVFLPFEQGRRTRSEGTGLGLSICREIVELMGGAMGVRSSPGRGSLFWVKVPLRKGLTAPASAETVLSPPALPVWPRRPRILVVEDNASNRRVATLLLRKLGCEVVLAMDGTQGLRAASQNVYDLVLMDCEMPGMDGYECSRRMRQAQSDDAPIVILALSAHFSPEHQRRCLTAGMDGVLAKPVRLDDLQAALLRWIPRLA